MKMKLLGILGATMFACSAHASLIIGNTYQDTNNLNWTYIGDYNVGSGPIWMNNPANFSAIDAATLVFGALNSGASYAISTVDTFVNHSAWYDGYGDGTYLPLTNSYGGGQSLAENYFNDAGALGYSDFGDYSAYIGGDRAAQGGGAFNHVFVSATNVPEPTSIALMSFAVSGLALSRSKRRWCIN